MNAKQTLYRITLTCSGCPPEQGEQGAAAITREFASRPWHQNVRCDWDGKNLVLRAENDFDDEGKALMDEFSDAISGYIESGFDGDITVRSIVVLE